MSDYRGIMNGVLQLLFFNDWCPVFSGAVFLLLDYRLFAFTLFHSVKEFCLKSVNTWQRYHRQYGVSFFCWTWCRPIISVRSDCLFHDLSTYSFSRGNDAVLFFGGLSLSLFTHFHSYCFVARVWECGMGKTRWESNGEGNKTSTWEWEWEETGIDSMVMGENGNEKIHSRSSLCHSSLFH